MADEKRTASGEETVDLLVVGSGAGGMTAALAAHDRGARVLLIEKDGQYGGSTAMSGGALWIPNNHLMPGVGIADSAEEARTYLRHKTAGVVAEDRLDAYLKYSVEMARYLCDKTRVELQALPSYADYYPEAPGGKPGARTVEPKNFDARRLGKEFHRMREPHPMCLIMKRVAMTALQANTLLTRAPGWQKLVYGMMFRYAADVGGRLASPRDRNLACGNALIGMLRLSLLDRNIPLWLNTPARELLVENGRVAGVRADREGTPVTIRAARGVVLAAGGFESNQEMREQYLPGPTDTAWTSGSPYNTGDAIRMGMRAGAALDLMDHAWWSPNSRVPGEDRARMILVERSLPGSVIVNRRGERFVNEAAPYIDIVYAMYGKNTPESPSVPAYLVFDGAFRKKYPCGPVLQSSQQPDWMLPKALKQGYLVKDGTLSGLADKMGIDPGGIEETAKKMAEYARTGKDPDFHKGDSVYDRYYGDPTVTPNPCLAPLDTPPFYGLVVHAGDLGTKGGLKTDARARVTTGAGEPIPGLYAIGNCSASVMGHTYPGAGSTIGPAATFGYVAALDATGE
jgi:3-oxosteroid 1-dehydrogenase